MSNPYFEIGEEVILASEMLPQFNGEYIVSDRRACNNIGYEYWLENDPVNGKPWYETLLRKKHKPNNESFSQLITNLNKQTEPV